MPVATPGVVRKLEWTPAEVVVGEVERIAIRGGKRRIRVVLLTME